MDDQDSNREQILDALRDFTLMMLAYDKKLFKNFLSSPYSFVNFIAQQGKELWGAQFLSNSDDLVLTDAEVSFVVTEIKGQLLSEVISDHLKHTGTVIDEFKEQSLKKPTQEGLTNLVNSSLKKTLHQRLKR